MLQVSRASHSTDNKWSKKFMPINKNYQLFKDKLAVYGIIIEPMQMNGLEEQIEIYQVIKDEQKANRNHWDSREGTDINFLVTHYTVCNFLATMNLFTQDIPSGRVSAHYVITEQEEELPGGVVFCVVPEEYRAWHAGPSCWEETKNLNASSIGIEFVNKGFDDKKYKYFDKDCNWYPFCRQQIASGNLLMASIQKRWGILPQNIIAHGDIAVGRKSDPGPLFPWGDIYTWAITERNKSSTLVHTANDLGIWLNDREIVNVFNSNSVNEHKPLKEPLPQGISEEFCYSYLQKLGYSDQSKQTENLWAFRMHHVDNQCPGIGITRIVEKKDMAMALGLVSKYKP